jgi:hypothetical protein
MTAYVSQQPCSDDAHARTHPCKQPFYGVPEKKARETYDRPADGQGNAREIKPRLCEPF